ncbi:hypothetical protein KIW84_063175 [Lathyrus oleraceus]|uniref:Uncharacterized protein n=1 Tax=Pisum sativum TaxID=3888 RepID=A0A9D5A7E7_PEA|nr:hypothetical protein KIW84_063175 [Pisum sativum]
MMLLSLQMSAADWLQVDTLKKLRIDEGSLAFPVINCKPAQDQILSHLSLKVKTYGLKQQETINNMPRKQLLWMSRMIVLVESFGLGGEIHSSIYSKPPVLPSLESEWRHGSVVPSVLLSILKPHMLPPPDVDLCKSVLRPTENEAASVSLLSSGVNGGATFSKLNSQDESDGKTRFEYFKLQADYFQLLNYHDCELRASEFKRLALDLHSQNEITVETHDVAIDAFLLAAECHVNLHFMLEPLQTSNCRQTSETSKIP